jgi:hypothetical protein
MRRFFFIAGLVLGLLMLASLGVSISLARSVRSKVRARRLRARAVLTPSLAFERSTAL